MQLLRVSFQAALIAAASSVASASSFKNDYYDYIVVGGGPSGIITAERFVEAGKKVLLLERGHGPTVTTGANDTLPWSNELTPIDLPGMSANVGALPEWKRYMCTDTPGMAACVLGGGTTVNYMVFIHPSDHDFDHNSNWPTGWKWKDVKPAAERLYKRNAGTTQPSADGKRYDQGAYKVLSTFFNRLGWKSVDSIEEPDKKHKVYTYPAWNIEDHVRAGPVRTYLPLVQKNESFDLHMGVKVLRVVREGSKITGVEVQNGSNETEIVTVGHNGRVVLSAGALSTPRLLFNSGIGPAKQIEMAQSSGISVPAKQDWIQLPVGVGLMDHPIFTMLVQTNATFGVPDYDSILNGSDTADIELYKQGSGLLTQGKHRMIFFSSNTFRNHTRYYQGSCAPTENGVVEIKVYMTHGLTSHGVLGLDSKQNTVIEKSPYMQTPDDRVAARAFVQGLARDIQAPGSGLTLVKNTNTTAILKDLQPGTHYASTAKMGVDDGRKNGTSVVDTNTKVYGTDNLFIVDGSIHPDLSTGNIQATIMVVAEAAAAKILACN
ncbi:Cellobiose dehydrogenase (acceptor) [Penicillium ucsense]|uniref:Cellobiose dehydrogenase (Acceptor) n=1 Tax=Penicillium ucsense TaxID=2839758 RepID=A0A8J8VYU8_9EURO|nr:Cellobiose dehydrogenase (acceptor) [Penicillium ucsense]KAF7733712.1 Cellobiose dehydrogenase (acceptor) [Penicillium ucsense]